MVTYKSAPVPVSEPERRVRGKTTLKALQYLTDRAPIPPSSELEACARNSLLRGELSISRLVEMIQALQQQRTRNQRDKDGPESLEHLVN